MKEINYLEIVNPVITSAKSSLTMLKEAGLPEAEKLFSELHLDMDLNKPDEVQLILKKCFSVIYELRYKAINTYARRSGFKNIIDLGCGLSPRGLFFKEFKKYNYIGIDLPDVIKKFRIYSNEIKYIAADITDYSSLEKAFSEIDGKVLVVTEGVLPYLTKSELKTVVQNIQVLMKKYNGVWLTADFVKNDFIEAVLKAFFEEEIFIKLKDILLQKRKESYLAIFNENEPAALTCGSQILSDAGFECKLLPFIPEEIIPEAMKNIPKNVKDAVISNYKDFKIQCLYLSSLGFADVDPDFFKSYSERNKKFSFSVSNNSDATVIYLSGRLDSISAPEFANYFENSTLTNRTVILNCEELEYISSAGLRVFLMIYKGNKGKVLVINENQIVREVLEQTGFAQFFCK